FDMPPTWPSASKTSGITSDRRSNSSPAVRPAGPAPAMTATFLPLWVCDISRSLCRCRLHEQHLSAQYKVADEGKSGRETFGQKIVHRKVIRCDYENAVIDDETH